MPDRDPEIEAHFPNLPASGYRVTSEASEVPNCIGWALRDTSNFWDPLAVGMPGVYWPPGIPTDDSVATWMQLFALFSFATCESPEVEAE